MIERIASLNIPVELAELHEFIEETLVQIVKGVAAAKTSETVARSTAQVVPADTP